MSIGSIRPSSLSYSCSSSYSSSSSSTHPGRTVFLPIQITRSEKASDNKNKNNKNNKHINDYQSKICSNDENPVDSNSIVVSIYSVREKESWSMDFRRRKKKKKKKNVDSSRLLTYIRCSFPFLLIIDNNDSCSFSSILRENDDVCLSIYRTYTISPQFFSLWILLVVCLSSFAAAAAFSFLLISCGENKEIILLVCSIYERNEHASCIIRILTTSPRPWSTPIFVYHLCCRMMMMMKIIMINSTEFLRHRTLSYKVEMINQMIWWIRRFYV